jgi:ribosome-binding protein aMBF1 (putative translation factor)
MARYQMRETNLKKETGIHGISVRSLAKYLGVRESKIRNFLSGKQAPNIYEAILLADLLYIKDLRNIWKVTILEGIGEEPENT